MCSAGPFVRSRELDRFELVVYARHPEELPEVRAKRVTSRPTLAWEQVGLARAAREVDVLLTWTERLPLVGARTVRRLDVRAADAPDRAEPPRRRAARGSAAATS